MPIQHYYAKPKLAQEITEGFYSLKSINPHRWISTIVKVTKKSDDLFKITANHGNSDIYFIGHFEECTCSKDDKGITDINKLGKLGVLAGNTCFDTTWHQIGSGIEISKQDLVLNLSEGSLKFSSTR
ncbi:MAG: hypothetical protein RLZZ210_195 [Pseudomonadota bacterium]|jgi:hypothetical protein